MNNLARDVQAPRYIRHGVSAGEIASYQPYGVRGDLSRINALTSRLTTAFYGIPPIVGLRSED